MNLLAPAGQYTLRHVIFDGYYYVVLAILPTAPTRSGGYIRGTLSVSKEDRHKVHCA